MRELQIENQKNSQPILAISLSRRSRPRRRRHAESPTTASMWAVMMLAAAAAAGSAADHACLVARYCWMRPSEQLPCDSSSFLSRSTSSRSPLAVADSRRFSEPIALSVDSRSATSSLVLARHLLAAARLRARCVGGGGGCGPGAPAAIAAAAVRTTVVRVRSPCSQLGCRGRRLCRPREKVWRLGARRPGCNMLLN